MDPFPPDTLQIIFEGSSEVPDPRNPWILPIRLGSVCASWRMVTFQSKKIWSNIIIPPILAQREPYRLLHYFLVHSGLVPLSIDFQFPESETSSSCHILLYRAILSKSERWQTFAIRGMSDWAVQEVFPLPPIPILSRLTLGGELSGTVSLPQVIVPSSGSLYSLTLEGAVPVFLGPQKFPWSQIQILVLLKLDENEDNLLNILPLLSHLRNLKIESEIWHFPDTSQTHQVIHLPQVTSFIYKGVPLTILETLRFPNLVELRTTWFNALRRYLPVATTLRHMTIQDSFKIFSIVEPFNLRSLTIEVDPSMVSPEQDIGLKFFTIPLINWYFPKLESLFIVVKLTALPLSQ